MYSTLGDMSFLVQCPSLQMSLFGWSADPVTWYKSWSCDPVTWYKVGHVTLSHGTKVVTQSKGFQSSVGFTFVTLGISSLVICLVRETNG